MTEIDTGTTDLLAHIDGHVGVITFNRPERRNALSEPMYHGFNKALPELALNTDVRVVLLTGAGGAFCAGGDVKGMNEANQAAGDSGAKDKPRPDGTTYIRSRQRWVSEGLYNMPKPVVAALPGAAAGAGFSMALAADIRIAAERALLVSAFANIGASGDFGGSWFLTQLVGPAKAKEIFFTSPRLTARDAEALGLVNQVFPDEGFEEAALTYCHEMAQRAPVALRHMKENINRALSVDLPVALDAEASAMSIAMATADHREAAAAFVEKRAPKFTGR